eukprot:9361783-Alexandrium_andersonii.AAC.1
MEEPAAGRARGVARFAMVVQRQPTDLAGEILVGRETAEVLRIASEVIRAPAADLRAPLTFCQGFLPAVAHVWQMEDQPSAAGQEPEEVGRARAETTLRAGH